MSSSDYSRQWGVVLEHVARDHIRRYELACTYAEGRILDAACGCGYGSSILTQKGVVTGVDYSSEAIEWAERHFFSDVEYICAKIEDEPWAGKFETVVSLETIEHLKDPSQALQAFRRACIGKLVVSVPNEERYPFNAENFAKDASPHFRHYTPGEFESLLASHGFTVLDRFSQISKHIPEILKGTDGRFLVYVCE